MLHKLAKVAGLLVLVVSVSASSEAQTIKGTVTVSTVPTDLTSGVGVNYLTNRVYVAVYTGNSTDKLSVINGSTNAVIKTITIPPIGQVVAVDVVRNLVYVAGTYFDVNGVQQNKVAVVNGANNQVVSTLAVSTTAGFGIESIAVNPVTGEVYVANASDDVVDVINVVKGKYKVVNQISVAPSPFGVTVNPFTNEVYVGLSDGTADVISGKSKTVTTTTTVGSTNGGVATDWATGNVFVVNNAFGTSTVGVLSGAGAVLANVTVGNTPFAVAVDQLKDLAYVTNTQDGTVSVIQGSSNTVSAIVPVVGLYIDVNPVTATVYVPSGVDNTMTVIAE